MVVPQEDIGGLPLGLRVHPESGWKDNGIEAEGSFDPGDSEASLHEAGRITGYELEYYDPTQAAIRSGRGLVSIVTWVDLFSTEGEASTYLRRRVDYARSLSGTSPREGVKFGKVSRFEVDAADEGYGLRESVVIGGDRVFRTRFFLRRGRIVGGGMVVRADDADAAGDATRVAGLLDSRVQIGLRGGPNGDPVFIPRDGVPLGQQPTQERPEGAPDLAALTLDADDVPAAFLCDDGQYIRATPPRITFRRVYCPEGASVGETRLIALSNQISAFESEQAAEVSLTLTGRIMTSPDGAKNYAANFAATSGLVATDLERRQVELPDGAIGVLSTFKTRAGRLAGFTVLVQDGSGLATLDAIGLAEGFDHRDLLPLVETLHGRLGDLD
jgi:hypothetical protein